MDSKPNWPYRQQAGGYNFVDGASAGFDGAVLTIPSSLTGFRQTAFGYVQDPDGGTTMCIGGILTSYSKAPCCSECGRRMHINGTVTREIKHVPFGNIPVSIGFQKYLYRCPECGDCISEPVEFQADGHRITKQLQQMVEDCLAYGFNLTDTAQITGVGRNVVKSIDKARLTKQYITADGKLKKPEAYSEVLGIDEIMIHAGHQYATIIINSEVHIDMFDDRLEIFSPGGMYDGINVQDRDIMRVPSERRNPILADVFTRLIYMERRGSGFKKIIEDYQFQHNYTKELAPEFLSEHGAFFLTLKNLNYYQGNKAGNNPTNHGEINGGINGEINGGINLFGTERKIVAAIRKNPDITRTDLSSALSIGTSTIDRTIRKLKNSGILERIGSNKTGYWKVNEP